MAELQDIDDIGEIEAVEEQIEQAEQQEAKPDLPEKYRGKSVEDVIRMHQEAEKLMSRQAQEVGEVRKLADELIKSQLKPKPEPEVAEEIDFFENPQEAVRRAVETNPKVLAAEQYAIQVQRQQAQQTMIQKHPDAPTIVNDPEFQSWVKSSKVRERLFQQADAEYDFDAADELLSTFKELRQVKIKRDDSANDESRKQTLKAASVDTGGSGESTKKIYRRADLIRLKISNPSKYEAMQDEIMAAYNEDRVR